MIESQNKVNLSELANCRLPSVRKPMLILLAVVVVGLVAAILNCQFVDHSAHRFMQAYLVAFAWVLSISLGSLFFVLIQHLTRAGWSVVVRRFAEVFGLNLWVVGVLFLPIAWSVWQGDGLVYRWSIEEESSAVPHAGLMDGERALDRAVRPVSLTEESSTKSNESSHGAGHSLTKPMLNNFRFLATWAVLLAIWIGLAAFYYRCSVAQDKTGDSKFTRKMEWWSGIGTILFGISLTLGAFDLLMSLDPMWYSTIFGVYYFSGCAVAGLATLLLVVLSLSKLNVIPAVISDEVQRDLGRLLFAFVFFWAYIGFSQYMLLWYANIPETTGWLVRRGMSTATQYANSWGWLAVLLLFAHFMIPFCGFMSRHIKSNSKWMVFWCVWLLVIHYLDLYWIVIPESNPGWTMSFVEIGTVAAVLGVYGIAALGIASRVNLFPAGDPRMPESLAHHAMY